MRTGIRHSRLFSFGACTIVVGALLSTSAPASAVELVELLAASQSAADATGLPEDELVALMSAGDSAAPSWPVQTFLLAETWRLRGETERARGAYGEIIDWAAADPYEDGSAGSGLSALALWRMLRDLNADAKPDHARASEVLEKAKRIQNARLVRGMYHHPLLPSLPQLEEDIARQLARLAWATGDKKAAMSHFYTYLSVASSAHLTPIDLEILKQLERDRATPARVALLRGRRLVALNRRREAYALLEQAFQSETPAVRAESGLLLAQGKFKDKRPRLEVTQLLDEVLEIARDPDVAQRALLLRAKTKNRAGNGRDLPGFREDLEMLLKEYPRGSEANDALYQLAVHYETARDVKTALQYYKQLRELDGQHDGKKDLAAYRPALMLYARGEADDLENAAGILQRHRRERAKGDLHLHTLFWLARISEELGDVQEARKLFSEVVDDGPFDYYGIRARMHLNEGREARRLERPDPKSRAQLRASFAKRSADTGIPPLTAYHRRLDQALASGLYARALAIESRLRPIHPSQRLQDISLDALDQSGLFTGIATLLSLRQDAIAARDAQRAPAQTLALSGAVGERGGDWPLAMSFLLGRGVFDAQLSSAQGDPRFLAAAYPTVYNALIKRYCTKYEAPPALVYGLMRQESLFYPAALSPEGALGLLQIMPGTFRNLDGPWKLLAESGASTRAAFLLDPELSIRLGAQWTNDLLDNNQGSIVLATMEHISGRKTVSSWLGYWQQQSERLHDEVEFRIESAPHFATRLFARGVLTDVAIVDASGFFTPTPAEVSNIDDPPRVAEVPNE